MTKLEQWDLRGLLLALLCPILHWQGKTDLAIIASMLLVVHWGRR